jgi:MFS family permease
MSVSSTQNDSVTEQTPLPGSTSLNNLENTSAVEHAQKVFDHQAVYNRFTPAKKRSIVVLVSFTGLVPLFIADSFIPSIPQISSDLDSTGEVISFAVSISIFTGAFAMLMWASYSTLYGRRPIYLASLPLITIGSIAVGRSQTVLQLMSSRVIQAIGASAGLSLGAGVIGDIYKLEERGTAMGVFFAAVLIGPALAPLTGGEFDGLSGSLF